MSARLQFDAGPSACACAEGIWPVQWVVLLPSDGISKSLETPKSRSPNRLKKWLNRVVMVCVALRDELAAKRRNDCRFCDWQFFQRSLIIGEMMHDPESIHAEHLANIGIGSLSRFMKVCH